MYYFYYILYSKFKYIKKLLWKYSYISLRGVIFNIFNMCLLNLTHELFNKLNNWNEVNWNILLTSEKINQMRFYK